MQVLTIFKEKDREVNDLKGDVSGLQARVSKHEERIENAETYESDYSVLR